MQEDKKNSRQMQAEQTKARLFDAALSLLQETGFERIRIQDIVARAGVSVGAFYVYYQSKLDVFYQAYEIADAYFETTVASRLTRPTATERLLLFFEEYAVYNSEITDFRLTKLLFNANNKCFNRDYNKGMLKILLAIVQQGVDSGELTCGCSPKEIANHLMIAARGLVYNWCTMDGSYPLKPAMHQYLTLLLKGLSG